MKTLFQFIVAILLVVAVGAFWTERKRAAALRQENEALRQAETAAQRAVASGQAGQHATRNEELERLRTEAGEVHKLRSEVSQLRAAARDADRLRTENQQLRASNQQLQSAPRAVAPAAPAVAAQEAYYPKENWAFAGFATPEATLQSAIWAMREGDTKTFLASVTPEERERMEKESAGKSEAEVSANARKGVDKLSAVRILERKTISDDEVLLSVYAEGGEDKVQKISMKRYGTEWKLAPKRE